MNQHSDYDNDLDTEPRYEVWLAERELMSAAVAVRDAGDGESVYSTRIVYTAAWMRFMVALCNLPVDRRPEEVERVLEVLRSAHLLHSRGDFLSPYLEYEKDPASRHEDPNP